MASASGSMGLFLQAAGYGLTEGTALFMHGSTESGVFNQFTLFMPAESGVANAPSGMMNVFLLGASQDQGTKNVNLFIGGVAYTINDSIPLFLLNSGVDGSTTLFIEGSGITEDAMPAEKTFNLFIRRGAGDAINLYARGPGTEVSGTMTLYIESQLMHSGVVTMAIPDVVGTGVKTARLYTQGW